MDPGHVTGENRGKKCLDTACNQRQAREKFETVGNQGNVNTALIIIIIIE